MSAGTRVYTVRLSNDLAQVVDDYLGVRQESTQAEPWTFSTLVRVALLDFLKKTLRSGRSKQENLKEDLDAIKDEVIDLNSLYPPGWPQE
jgi:hypothetical protein